MHRHFSATILALLALGLFITPVFAGDEEALREEIEELKDKVDALQSQQKALLEKEIDDYLVDRSAWEGAEGEDGLQGVSIHARFTAVMQASVGLDPANRAAVNGDVDLDFDFQVTDNLELFIHLTANTVENGEGPDSFPGLFQTDFFSGGSFGTPYSFGPIAGPTFSGLTDGIGVNGTVSVQPGSITVYEAGIRHAMQIKDKTLHTEIGSLDPRTRFLQNAFADDENTQFINNLFDDSPSVLWLTDASGRTVLGIHQWMSFGGNQEFTVNWGWFNTPGQFFNMGQLYVQLSWTGEVNGRAMNVRVMGWIDDAFRDATGDGSAGGGASWDWWVTDKVGLWFRLAVTGGDVNPVESDFSVGVVLNGLIGSRPDDTLGISVGFISVDDTIVAVPEDMEVTLEIYYRYMYENGKMQITPHLMIVSDPGGNASPWQDDLLVILGIRIHVPF